MQIIIVGIMQGNLLTGIHDQSYRQIISAALNRKFKNVEIIDPDKLHPNRLSYDYKQSKEMFSTFVKKCKEVDLVISYLPQASMGTAVEMWEANKAKVPILTISPLKNNWVVKLLSTKIFANLEDFVNYIETDGLNREKIVE